MPLTARFGKVRVGAIYETEIQCKNEDVMPQRFSLRQPKCSYIHVYNDTPGPVAQGMRATLKIEIDTTKPETIGKIQDEFQLITKTEICKIGIFAKVLSQEEFDVLQAEVYKLHNRPLLLTTVREKGKEVKKNAEGSIVKGIMEEGETSLSGVKLPKIGPGDDTRVELDPNKKLEDITGKGRLPRNEDDDE